MVGISADRRWSNCILVINNVIACYVVPYIRGLTVVKYFSIPQSIPRNNVHTFLGFSWQPPPPMTPAVLQSMAILWSWPPCCLMLQKSLFPQWPWTLAGKTQDDNHNDVIKWKHFPRYWPFVRGIHRSLVNSPHKGQGRGALVFSMISARINDWANNREAGDLRRHLGHYDVSVMAAGTLIRHALHWRHDGCDGVANHWRLDCLLNRLFRRKSKKTSKLRVTGLCEGNSPVIGEFPAQRASNAGNFFNGQPHHVGTRIRP